MTSVTGSFYNGVSSKKQEALLKAIANGQWCVVRTDGTLLCQMQAIAQTKVSSRLGNMPRIVRFADGGVFETPDNDGVDRLLAPHRSRWHGLAHRLESKFRYALLGLVVTVAFLFAIFLYGIPAGAKIVAYQLPIKTLSAVERQVLETMDQSYITPSTLPDAEQQRLRQLMLAFIPEVDGMPLTIVFRNGNPRLGANAFALPSGTIVFTDQLVALAKDDKDLLAVYAHEVGHVKQRHGMRRILQASAISMATLLFFGDVSASTVLISIAPTVLIGSSYSRDFEREADRFAWQQMQQHRIPAQHFTVMLERLRDSKPDKGKKEEEEAETTGFLDSHPSTEERIRNFGKSEE